MLDKIFNPDNLFWRECGKLADILILSLLWVLCSLPIFTMGAATTALYTCVVKCVRENQVPVYSRFFRVFREDFKTSALATLMLLPLAAIVWVVYFYLLQGANEGYKASFVLYVAVCVAMVIPVGIIGWSFPILSRFTFTPGGLVATAFKFTFAHLPATVVISLVTIVGARLCLSYIFPLFIVPATVALINSFVIERVFKKYLPPEEKKDHEDSDITDGD